MTVPILFNIHMSSYVWLFPFPWRIQDVTGYGVGLAVKDIYAAAFGTQNCSLARLLLWPDRCRHQSGPQPPLSVVILVLRLEISLLSQIRSNLLLVLVVAMSALKLFVVIPVRNLVWIESSIYSILFLQKLHFCSVLKLLGIRITIYAIVKV